MLFDSSNIIEANQARTTVNYYIEKGFIFELNKKQKKRTINQNSYLHVLFQYYGALVGSTLNEAKTDIKRACPFGTYEKKGVKYLVETSKMDTKELTDFIDWFRNYSGMNGHYLPTADEYKTNNVQVDNKIKQNKEFL